jgi:hypothetical protein
MAVRPAVLSLPIPLDKVPALLAGRGVQVSMNRLQDAVSAGAVPSRLEGGRRLVDDADLDASAAYFRNRPVLSHRQGAAARAQAGKR